MFTSAKPTLAVQDGDEVRIGETTWTARFTTSSELELTHVEFEDDEKQQFTQRLADRRHEVAMRKQEVDALKSQQKKLLQAVAQVFTFSLHPVAFRGLQ